jgi:transposase
VKHNKLKDRWQMVAAARRGMGLRKIARKWGVALATVQRWVKRARGRALSSVDWADRSHAPRRVPLRCAEQKRQAIVTLRRQLAQGALGFVGAASIHEQLEVALGAATPSVRTIGRVLAQEGLLLRTRRRRHEPPPQGWYLPRVATRTADLDSYDFIEDLRLEDGPLFHVLTTRSQWHALAAAWATPRVSAAQTCQFLLGHWRKHGTPAYAQFDNGTVFEGGHIWPDTFGQVTRFCLALGVTPVFTPPAEPGLQNLVENFNGLWQQKVWQRFFHADLRTVQVTSDRFTAAWCARRARTIEAAPSRTPLAPAGRLDLRQLTPGTIVYVRRCDESGHVQLLGHRFAVAPSWSHRLARIEVDLANAVIRCFGLRRKDPDHQPLLTEIPYQPRRRKTFQAAVTSILWH